MNVTQILSELVSINSVSSNSNAEIIKHLVAHVERLKLRTRFFDYTDAAGVTKSNLLAFPHDADGESFELILVGHTDTVPFDSAWTNALTLTTRDAAGETRLYARGACDTKCSIATALAAVETVDRSGLTKPFALLFTADEEVGCLGAKHVAELRPFTARRAIIGEPTNLQPVRAGKGYCLADVIVRGRECHSAHPERGASAIMRAARLINRIDQISEDLKHDAHTAFDPPHTTINIGTICGGTAKNILAGECRFTLEWRSVPDQDALCVAHKVEAAIAELQVEDADFDATLNVTRTDSGVEIAADNSLVRWMEDASGKESCTVAFGTEAPQLARLGADAVVFGAGDIRVAHTSGEYVPQAELEACADVLRRALERFCG